MTTAIGLEADSNIMKKASYVSTIYVTVLAVVVFIMASVAECAAQTSAYPQFKHEKFNVEAPSFDKIVRVTSNGVNVRKQPNAQSPRLVMKLDLTESCMDCPPDLIWVNRKLRRDEQAIPADELGALPYVGETGDWYEVYLDQPHGTQLKTTAYIMKKFCKVGKLRPLQLPSPNSDELIVVVKSGKYAGLCLESYVDAYEGVTYLRLGKYENGMFIFPYSINIVQGDNNGNIRLNEEEQTLIFGKKLWKDSIGEINLDLNTLIQQDGFLEFLIKNLDKMNNSSIFINYGVEGDDSWYCIEKDK